MNDNEDDDPEEGNPEDMQETNNDDRCTKVDNDVRCAALGELNFGAGKGCENLICITVGTGIGSGLIVNGKLVRGASNAAGEIGHIKLDINGGPLCGCGDRGRYADPSCGHRKRGHHIGFGCPGHA